MDDAAGLDASDGSVADASDSSVADSAVSDSGPDAAGGDAGNDAGPDASACGAGSTCTGGPVPAGWTLVEFTETTRPQCSSGYGSSTNTIDDLSAPGATCACSCAVTTGGSCETGTFGAKAGNALGCTLVSTTYPANSACVTGPNFSPTSDARLAITAGPVRAGSLQLGRGDEPRGASGQPRAHVPGDGFVHRGPQGMRERRKLRAHAGNGLDLPGAGGGPRLPERLRDEVLRRRRGRRTRGPAPAAPAPGRPRTCGNVTLSMFTDPQCGDGGVLVVDANGSCNALNAPAGVTYKGYQYAAQVQGEACNVTAASPTGSVTLTGTRTICCQ